MTQRPQLHPEATAEIESAATWYENQRSGLGREFVGEIGRSIRAAAATPRIGSPVDGIDPTVDIRRSSTRRFPYQVIYVVVPEGSVVVVAIAHERREPAYWSERLEED